MKNAKCNNRAGRADGILGGYPRKAVFLKIIEFSIKGGAGIVLLVICIQWCVQAILKYHGEPVSTRIVFQYGDDGLGNISFPVVSLCRSNFTFLNCNDR
jgi:hypothetical protein